MKEKVIKESNKMGIWECTNLVCDIENYAFETGIEKQLALFLIKRILKTIDTRWIFCISKYDVLVTWAGLMNW